MLDLLFADADDNGIDTIEEPMRFVLNLPRGGVSPHGGGVSPPLLHGQVSAWTPAASTALVDPNAPSAKMLAELFGSREPVLLKRLGVIWRDNDDHAWFALQVWEVAPALPRLPRPLLSLLLFRLL